MSASGENLVSESNSVVTRFAPSPTGFLHIGGARTALFNWLFARHHGGKFLLRIEDTDKARSTTQAIDAILDGMRWLGLDWDGHEYYQSQFWARHAEVAHKLLDRGHAYRCYMTQEELAAQREKAQAERRPFRIDSPWRDVNDEQGDKPFVIRLKSPREGETVIEDKVQGRVAVQNSELDDFILLRSDGTPTYMLAVVVDDHDMGVTHVIRGDDHLNNAFRQLEIIRAMGWPEPTYAHVPLIHGPDGAKLSKRHGALGVDAYRDELGLLPEAVSNYLLRLGWGHGDDEIISREQAIEWFDLAHVGKSPSRFDFKKLENLNGHYIREADDARLADLVAPETRARCWPEGASRPGHARAQGSGARSQPAGRRREIPLFEPPARVRRSRGRASDRRRAVPCSRGRTRRWRQAEWNHDALEQSVREVAEAEGVKLGKLAQPLRAALTGRTTSPGIFDVLALLGKSESLARIEDQMLEPNE